MQNTLGTLLGKLIKSALMFRSRGGHALPGLIVETVFPAYAASMLAKLPEGVVVITGTNGKTTTTKIVVHLLRAAGKKVLTNSTGSNLMRGVVSSIAQNATLAGKLPMDIAVLEMDEATARLLTDKIKPRWVLGLNVSRDQLDRYGEIDTVAARIGEAMEAAGEGIVVNSADPKLSEAAASAAKHGGAQVYYFGAAKELDEYFPTDYELAAVDNKKAKSPRRIAEVELTDFSGQNATYRIDGKDYKTKLLLSGQHNFLNAAAALTLVRHLLPATPADELVSEVAKVPLAFGRGETYKLKNGEIVELVLVKNPASFTQALASYNSKNTNFMITINDNIADGRDVSWLWDVNLKPLQKQRIAVVSGSRAADMALRLSYDEIAASQIEPKLDKALTILAGMQGRKVVLATYTAMLKLHKVLNEKGQIL